MANRTTRLGRNIRTFDTDIKTTSDYIKIPCPPPVGQTNGTRLGWTTDQIEQWLDYRSRWDALKPLYENKKSTRTTEVITDMNDIIKEAVAYDKKHKLYNQVAANPNAVTADYIAFNIVSGTSMADSTNTRSPEPGTKIVSIALKKSSYLMHELLVTSPDHKGRGKEEGVKEILIYKAVVAITEVAPALSTFQYIGDVSRGLIKVNHDETTQGMRAWYIGRVKNSRGEIGDASEPVGFIII